jgi:LacI family transcriptional regulator
VTVNNEEAGFLAAQHLLGLGHRRVGIVTGRLSFNDRQRARLSGAREAMRRAGLEIPDWLASEQDLTLAGGRSGCAALLQLESPPTGIIGAIDLIAIGCLQEAQAQGLVVPNSLSIVGIDDIDMSAYIRPSLTTVHIPTGQIGQMAAATVISLIRDAPENSQTNLPVELVVRRSTTLAPGEV